MLTVRAATAAIEFYQRAFGATEVSRLTTPNGQVVAEMSLEGNRFFVVDENPAAFNLSPESLGGTSVRMSLASTIPMLSRGTRSRPARPRSSQWQTSPTGCGRAACEIPTATTGSSASSSTDPTPAQGDQPPRRARGSARQSARPSRVRPGRLSAGYQARPELTVQPRRALLRPACPAPLDPRSDRFVCCRSEARVAYRHVWNRQVRSHI